MSAYYTVFDNTGSRLRRLGILLVPSTKINNYDYLFKKARAKFGIKNLTLRPARRK